MGKCSSGTVLTRAVPGPQINTVTFWCHQNWNVGGSQGQHVLVLDCAGAGAVRLCLKNGSLMTRASALDDTCTGTASAALPAAECAAWIALFDATQGTQWFGCSANRLDPCACGTTCAHRHITGLILPSMNLQGSLPAAIKNLTKLAVVYLSGMLCSGRRTRRGRQS